MISKELADFIEENDGTGGVDDLCGARHLNENYEEVLIDTPLSCAVAQGEYALIPELLKLGATPTARCWDVLYSYCGDPDGVTAIFEDAGIAVPEAPRWREDGQPELGVGFSSPVRRR